MAQVLALYAGFGTLVGSCRLVIYFCADFAPFLLAKPQLSSVAFSYFIIFVDLPGYATKEQKINPT